MKRFHVHVTVSDLGQGIRFYSTLFGAAPGVVREDYAKWMLDEPTLNFAISRRGRAGGIDHLGVEVESPSELEEIRARLQATDAAVTAETNVACCYARSDKYWITDPAGVRWESFRTLEALTYRDETSKPAEAGAGCIPTFQGEPPRQAAALGCPAPAEPTCCNRP